MKIKISVVIACYFNEKNIPHTVNELINNETLFNLNDIEFEYIFVDDGSKDKTYEQLMLNQQKFPDRIKVVKLSGNFGSHNAALAGLKYATGDCNVIMAADLQDPPSLILEMVEAWRKGFKLVLAQRISREDPFSSKLFAGIFYFLMRNFALDTLPKGGFDFVLFDTQVKKELLQINEKNTNIMYLLLWMKYPYVLVPYQRQKRKIGKSKWTMRKKIKLFLDSFIAFSFVPLRIITFLSILLGTLAIFYSLYIVIGKLYGSIDVKGWTTLMMVYLLTSSFIMFSIGILGEYLWRILDSTRNRPNFIITECSDCINE
jgi:glycosyltransferase involved in cell wall biosynthesis